MKLLTGARAALARWIAPPAAPRAQRRAYAGASTGRLTSDWNPLSTSADSEILTSIRGLRARSRQLCRDNEYALRGRVLVQTNIIGQGIGMQAQVVNSRGKLQDGINSQVEDAFARWSEKARCHTGGLLHFADIERMLAGELFEAGEAIVRMHHQAFGAGNKTPFALEVIEPERLIDTWQTSKAPNGNAIRMGVEVDQWGRPVAYWFHPTHPGDYQFTSFQPSRFIRVPAEEVIHLYVIDRLPQTRGVPWMHATLKRLNDINGYADAEIVKARAQASVMGFITSPEAQPSDGAEDDGTPVLDFEAGTIRNLLPGQRFEGFNPSAPNPAMDPFFRLMLRGVSAGIGASYESLSRDYSQSNYSSSRLALLDDRDLWRVLQFWFIRNFRMPVHRAWLQIAVMAGELQFPDFDSQRQKYEAVRFRPRGWSWVDPTKEVGAYIAAVQAGFMSMSDVIGLIGNGQDFEDVVKTRKAELDMLAKVGITFSTDAAPAKVGTSAGTQINDAAKPGTTDNTGDPNGADTAAEDDAAQQEQAA